MLALGPWVMDLLFGGDFDYERGGLVLVALGMGLYLSAATLNQALLAHGRATQAAISWLAAAAAFVAFLLAGRLRRPRAAGRARASPARRRRSAQRSCSSTGAYDPRMLSPWPSIRVRASRRPTSSWTAPTGPSGSRTIAASAWCCSSTPATTRPSARSSSAPIATTRRRSGRSTPPWSASPSQGVESHLGFSEKHGLNVPLLADEDGAVAKVLRRTRRGRDQASGDHRRRGGDRAPPPRPSARARLPDRRRPAGGARLASARRRR